MLTAKGKVFAGVALTLLVGVIYMVFVHKSTPPPNPLDQPAAAPTGFHFPFKSLQEEASFSKYSTETLPKLDYCQVYSGYSANRGVPIEFDAMISPTARQSAYYYKDPATGREYLPAYLIPRTGNGLAAVQAAAQTTGNTAEGTPGLGPCASRTNGALLLAFDKSIPPTTDLVRVKGFLWWSSSLLGSSKTVGYPDLPIVMVGAQKPQTASEIGRPAYRTRTLNIAVKSSDVIVRISRVEWASEETRVWAEVINLRGYELNPWEGISKMTIREQGKASQGVGTSSTDETIDQQRTKFDDLLPADEIPPKGTGTLKGYIVFPRTDPTKRIFLTMPDPDPDTELDASPITVKLNPDLNIDPMEVKK
jgi:hypothetical protein